MRLSQLLGSLLALGLVVAPATLPAQTPATPAPAPAPAAPPATAVPAEKGPFAEGTPEWIAEGFFKRKEFPERAKHVGGEFALRSARQPHFGAQFHSDDYGFALRVLRRTEQKVAIAVQLTFIPKQDEMNYYVFFERLEGRWKMTTLRRFQPPGLAGQMMAAFMTNADRMTAEDKREMAMLMAFNLRDSAVRGFFLKNREKLDAIVAAVLKAQVREVIHGGRDAGKIDKDTWKKVNELGLNYVHLKAPGWIDFNFAAMGETAVGLIYVLPRTAPPEPTPEKFILSEQLDGQWFLYRRM